MTTVASLADHWRAEAEAARRIGADGQAKTLEVCAADLEEALRLQGDDALDLRVASRESGYTAEHLGRLIRKGRILNAGTSTRPRILRRDLPRKPPTVARARPGLQVHQASPSQIVRALRKEQP